MNNTNVIAIEDMHQRAEVHPHILSKHLIVEVDLLVRRVIGQNGLHLVPLEWPLCAHQPAHEELSHLPVCLPRCQRQQLGLNRTQQLLISTRSSG